jgi:drug/metabolite transporter (DMT)-like permease
LISLNGLHALRLPAGRRATSKEGRLAKDRPMSRLDRLSPNAQGALWMLSSVMAATVMTVSIRVLTPDLHTAMLAFLRSAFGVVVVLPFLWRARARGAPIRMTLWPLHLARGLLIGFALNAGFYAIWNLPMATATILFFMAPIFATAFAALFLAERVGPRRWAAMAAGFLGALVILRPGVGALEPAMLAALASSLAFAGSLILGRRVSAADGTDAVFVSSSVVVVVATLPPALFVWELPQEAWRWAVVGVLVLASTTRTYSDIRAYASGDAGFLAPFSYLRLLTIGVAGYVWFAEVIDAWTVAGGAIIVGATLYISLREARLSRRAAREPAEAEAP